MALVFLAVTLGFVLYILVERPIHHANKLSSRVILSGTVAATITICALTYNLKNNMPEIYTTWNANRGLSDKSEFDEKFKAIKECITSTKPSVLIWGDSFGMHLVPGIVASMPKVGIAQATKSVCGPTLGVAPMEIKPKYGYGRKWA